MRWYRRYGVRNAPEKRVGTVHVDIVCIAPLVCHRYGLKLVYYLWHVAKTVPRIVPNLSSIEKVSV